MIRYSSNIYSIEKLKRNPNSEVPFESLSVSIHSMMPCKPGYVWSKSFFKKKLELSITRPQRERYQQLA